MGGRRGNFGGNAARSHSSVTPGYCQPRTSNYPKPFPSGISRCSWTPSDTEHESVTPMSSQADYCVVDLAIDMDMDAMLDMDDPFRLHDELLLDNFDVDCPIPPEADFLQHISNDLQIPMLLDDPTNYSAEDPCRNYLLDPLLSGFEEGSEWGSDAFPNLRPASEDANLAAMLLDEIKEEIKVEPDFPPSPPPSSAGSTSSLCNSEVWPGDANGQAQEEVKVILESPPLSPPFDNSPPESPQISSEFVSNNLTVPNSPASSPSCGSETVLKVVPCGLKLKAGKKVTLAQRPAPFIKPKPSAEVPRAEAVPAVIKTAVPTVKSVTLPTTVAAARDKRKTIVLSAKDFAALTQKVRENQTACTIGLLNGLKAVPTTLRLQPQPPKSVAPAASPQTVVQSVAQAVVPPIAVTTTAQPAVPTFAQVITPTSVPGKVPLIPCQSVTNSLPAVTTMPASTGTVRPLQTSAFSGTKSTSNPIRREMEMKAIKRQQRMIKNRESACLSRKKKKEYVFSLEGRLSELEQENVQLKLENEALKDRLNELENAMSWTKSPTFSVKTKKATAILAVLLMVSLNLGSFSSMMNRNPETLSMGNLAVGSPGMPGSVPRHGRSLLWAPALDMSSNNSHSEYQSRNSSGSASVRPICPLYINQTESIRLDSELRRWIRSDPEHPQDQNHQEPHHPIPSSASRNDLHKGVPQDQSSQDKPLGTMFNTSTMPSAASNLDGMKEKRTKFRRKSLASRISKKAPSSSNEVEVYGVRSPLYDYTAFLDSFHRRDDTFYVVSFSGDHILLPAQAHNTSSRPKMSLVLPAVPINKSMFGLNHIRMMQIDCEVTNTQMLRVRQDDIPAHFRPSAFDHYSNASAESSNSATANDSSSPSNAATARPNTSAETFHNVSQTEQNPASAAQPSYKPYFMKDGYPEKLALSPSQIHKLNKAFLKTRKDNTQSHAKNSSFVVQGKPTKLNNYP